MEVAMEIAGDDPNAIQKYIESRRAGKSHAEALTEAGRTKTTKEPRKRAKAEGPTDKGRQLGGESGKGVIKKGTTAPMTANMKERAEGLAIAKKAWKMLSSQMGGSWNSLSYAEKAELVLRVIPDVSGEVAVGVVEGVGSRATQGRGGEDAKEVIIAWGEKHGVKQSGSVIGVGVKASVQKEGTKAAARRGSKGSTKTTATTEKVPARTTREGREDVIASRVGSVVKDVTERVGGVTTSLRAKRQAPTWSIKDERGGPPEGGKVKTITVSVPSQTIPTKNAVGDTVIKTIYKTINVEAYTKDGKVYVLPSSGDWKLIDVDEFKAGIRAGYNPADGNPEVIGNPGTKPGRDGRAPIAKPSKEADPAKETFDVLSAVGKRGNTEFTDAVLMDAYEKVYTQYLEKNKEYADSLVAAGKNPEEVAAAMKGRGAPSVRDVAEAIGFDSESRAHLATVRRVRNQFKAERRRATAARNVAKGKKPARNRRKVQMEGTADEQRERFIASEDRRARKRTIPRAKPADTTPILSREEGTEIGRAVIAGTEMPNLTDPGVIAKRRKKNKELRDAVPTQMVEPSKIREAILANFPESEQGKKEARALRKIKELRDLGFPKEEIQKRVQERKIPNVSARVRKVAKGLGLLNVAAMTAQALSFVGDKKRND
jgi:hypothetical protein